MVAYIISAIIGVILIVIGISNTKGNINAIHSYHRHRVSEEDKPIFGKLMGMGSIICGIGIIIPVFLYIAGEMTNNPIFVSIGSYVTIAGLAIGIGIMTYATMKYNKGIF